MDTIHKYDYHSFTRLLFMIINNLEPEILDSSTGNSVHRYEKVYRLCVEQNTHSSCGPRKVTSMKLKYLSWINYNL